MPPSLWEARKVTLSAQLDVLYSWDTFRQWCLDSFSVHKHERNVLAQLETLRRTGSVAEYKAAHDVLTVKTNLPMQLRIHWREKGLNPDIAAKVKVDPLTYKECSEMTKHNLLPVLWMHMRLLLLLQLKRRGHILPISALAGLQLEGVTSSFELQQQKKPHVHPEHRQQIVLCHLRALLVGEGIHFDLGSNVWASAQKVPSVQGSATTRNASHLAKTGDNAICLLSM